MDIADPLLANGCSTRRGLPPRHKS